MFGLSNQVLQASIIRQQQQTLTVFIQSPGRVYTGLADEIGQGRVIEVRTKLADDIIRFIKS